MRACAVLLVFVGHVTHFRGLDYLGPLSLAGLGHWGVLIFFVHTCLVLMLSLERQWYQRGGANLFTSFMIRRSFRILPLSMLIVALIAIFRLPMMNLAPYQFTGAALNPSLVLSNLLLIQNLTKTKTSILAPLWSLPFEMQMYLFLPALFLFVRSARSIGRLVLLWVLVVGFAAVALRYPRIPWVVQYIPFLYIPCFLPGVIAYQIQRKKVTQLPSFLWPIFIAALTICFLKLSKWNEGNYPRDCAACLILGFAVPRFAQISTRWLAVISHTIAKYSYGIYLTHFFTIWFAGQRLSYLPKIDRLGIFVLLSAGLPVLLYHGIEDPMIRVGKKLADRLLAFTPPPKPAFAERP